MARQRIPRISQVLLDKPALGDRLPAVRRSLQPCGTRPDPGADVQNLERRLRMRGTRLAVIAAAGIGLAGTAGVSAAPFGGSALGNAANETSTVEHVQHWRWGSGGHRRWGSG